MVKNCISPNGLLLLNSLMPNIGSVILEIYFLILILTRE